MLKHAVIIALLVIACSKSLSAEDELKYWLSLAPVDVDAKIQRLHLSVSIASIDPSSRYVKYLGLATLHVHLANRGIDRNSNLAAAEKALEQAKLNIRERKNEAQQYISIIEAFYLVSLDKWLLAEEILLGVKSSSMTFASDIWGFINYQLADIYARKGEYESALALTDQVVNHYRLIDHKRHYTLALILKADLLQRFNQHEKAKSILDMLMGDANSENDAYLQGYCNKSLASYYNDSEQHDKAILYYEKALKLLKDKDREAYYRVLFALASAYYSIGKMALTLEQYATSQVYFSETDNHEMVALIKANSGVMYHEQGLTDRALPLYFDALEWAQKQNNKLVESSILNNVANLYQGTKSYEEALTFYMRGIALKKEVDDKKGYVDLLLNTGELLGKIDRKSQAANYFQQALSVSRASEYVTGVIRALRGYAKILVKTQDYETAKNYYYQALDLLEQTDNLSTHYVVHESIGNLYYQMQYFQEAEQHFTMAYDIAQQTNRNDHTIEIHEHLSKLYQATQEYQKANQYLTQLYQYKEAFAQESFNNEVAVLRADFEVSNRQREKEKAIKLLEVDNELKSMIIKNKDAQQRLTYFAIFCSLILVLLVLQRNISSRKTNKKLKALNTKLKELSYLDPLTRLYNRRYLVDEKNNTELKQAPCFQYGDKGTSAFFLVDIDYFKKINDCNGHQAGDNVLVEFAVRLKSVARESDFIIRWGGEEFLIIANDMSEADANKLAERVIEVVSLKPYQIAHSALKVTCSIGYCVFPYSADIAQSFEWEKKLQAADNALYQAKAEGRNRAIGVTLSQDDETKATFVAAELALRDSEIASAI